MMDERDLARLEKGCRGGALLFGVRLQGLIDELRALRRQVTELEREKLSSAPPYYRHWQEATARAAAAEAKVRRLEGLLAEIARDALGEGASVNRGLNSVQAVLRYFMPEGPWTEERLEQRIREREGRD